MCRALALVRKDLLEYRRTPTLFVPTALVGLTAILLPFIIALGVPSLTGEALSESRELRTGVEAATNVMPRLATLPAEAAIQAVIFQQFLFLVMLIPVAGGMSLAAHGIVGEKQARTLEPLLATSLDTSELLAAKMLAALLPSMAMMLGALVLYGAGIGLLAEPGVASVMLSARTIIITLVLAPLTTIAGLEVALAASSRTNDARAAQQIGVLVILPIVALFMIQVAGSRLLTLSALFVIAGILLVVDIVLLAVAVRLFDRETILTRWT